MPKEHIRIACETRDSAPLSSLEPLQGELKSLSTENYERLKREILKTGFAFPVFVWRTKDGDLKILGGHQRVRTLQRMEKEGYVVPQVPIVRIEAKNASEAKRRVLQDVSQYGKVESQGLYEFIHDANIGPDDLLESFSIPEI